MEKQLKLMLRRTLNTVRTEPKVIVTALRVIEREERIDAECQSRFKAIGFLPPDRPKNWRSKTMEVLKLNVMERVEGNQLEDREQNKMWLVRHLELIRMITLDDLRIVKTLCTPVFPPHYNILEHFLNLYHEALSNRLKVSCVTPTWSFFSQHVVILGDNQPWAKRPRICHGAELDHTDLPWKGAHEKLAAQHRSILDQASAGR